MEYAGTLRYGEAAHRSTPGRERATAYCLLIVLAVLLVTFARVRNTDSDSRSVLLTAESILKRGTVKLDSYGAPLLDRFGYTVQRKDGHYYSYFPLGSSIASLPFVALVNGWGLSMATAQGPEQIAIACVTSALSIALLAEIALLFLSSAAALSVTALFWFGTSLVSTTGTALWSHNFAVLFALGAILLALRSARAGIRRGWHWLGIAACLFMAYLCRPSMSMLAPFALSFLLTYDWKLAVKAGMALALLLAGFVGFSLHEFHQMLPDYYLPQRLSGSQFWTALYGNLFSPSRGLFIFSPFLVLVWLCFGSARRDFGLKASWLLIGLAWPVAHLIAISRFPVWWGGWSYGPRLMTDALPGLFLLTLRTWPVSLPGRARSRAALAVLGLAGAASVYINACQGLFNRYTYQWNKEPDSGLHQEVLFDWRYPQFLHDRARHEARLADWFEKRGALAFTSSAAPGPAHHVKLLHPGDWIEFTTDRCFYIDFIANDWSGIATLSRDGVVERKMDLFAKEADNSRPEFFYPPAGLHAYRLEVTQASNPASVAHEIMVNGVFRAKPCVDRP